LQIKAKIISCHTANFKPVKQVANGTLILPPSVFPGAGVTHVGGQISVHNMFIVQAIGDFPKQPLTKIV
jgi:hypothetical protein